MQIIIFPDGHSLATNDHPFPNGMPVAKHNVYDKHGNYIGADREPGDAPCRIVTRGAGAIGGKNVCELFGRYDLGDYGEGEAGFAVYKHEGETLYLIDDAVRSPEGEPPTRDPSTSHGPQTLLKASEY